MRRIAVALVLALLLIPTGMQAAAIRRASVADWTLAVYLDSDNDLDLWAQKDVNEMMTVGSTEAVNLIIFWDTYTGPGYAYRVLRDGLRELTDFQLNGVEPNMGDSTTLKEFVSYTWNRFSARQYALLCWDHGDDFRGCMYDQHVPAEGFDLLTHQEVATALAGVHVDVLIYAACVLSTVEVVYEYLAAGLRIDYYVANEGYDPMDGFPYDTVLTRLVAQPSMSPLSLSRMLVDEYIDYYASVGKAYSQSVTLSVTQVNKIGRVVADLSEMTQLLSQHMAGYAQIVSDARGRANLPWSENGWERLIDLPTFVKTIHDESLKPERVYAIDPSVVASVLSTSEALQTSLSDAILYHRNVDAMDRKGCLGMVVYFPTSRATCDEQLYKRMRFAQEGWMDFLNAYWEFQAE